jgi:hypothetical protein
VKPIDNDQLASITGGVDAGRLGQIQRQPPVTSGIDQIGRPYEPRPLAPNVKPANQVPTPPDFSRFYA